jgi:hypothetical protein
LGSNHKKANSSIRNHKAHKEEEQDTSVLPDPSMLHLHYLLGVKFQPLPASATHFLFLVNGKVELDALA